MHEQKKGYNMKTSQKGLDLIKKYEGCRLKAYLDPVGIPTIGYGHTSGVKLGQTITQAQAERYLKEDVQKFEKDVQKYDSIYHWTQSQFDALVSFTYNCGAGNLSKLTQKGNRTIKTISEKLLTYVKAGTGKALPGLVRRRKEEKDLFDSQSQQGEAAPEDETLWDAEAVKSLQEALNADGIRDKNGKILKVDGIKGSMTDSAVEKVLLKAQEDNGRYLVGAQGQVVKWLQMRLNTVFPDVLEVLGEPLKIDGKMGASTRSIVKLYQASKGLQDDGIAGPKTITELLKRRWNF